MPNTIPTRQAIERLVDTLWERLQSQESSVEKSDESDVSQFESTIDALDDFKKGVDAEIVRQKRFRNACLPIHRLPAELFLKILQQAVDFVDLIGWKIGHVHNLAKVSDYWYRTIISTPSFWPLLKDEHGDRIQSIVLKRNPTAPFLVWCTDTTIEAREEFMKRMAENAHRWRGLIVTGPYSEGVFNQLQTPAPNLKDLSVLVTSQPTRLLEIPDGGPLRHVDLTRVTLPWDSGRLAKLQSLYVESLDANLPSLAQLVSILDASPHLWRLVLRYWTGEAPAYLWRDAADLADKRIKLPSLHGLIIQSIPKAITHFLISHIDAPATQSVIVDDVVPSHFDGIIPTFSALVASAYATAGKINATYDHRDSILRIISEPMPERSNNWVYWADDLPGVDLHVSMKQAEQAQWRCISEFLSSRTVPICLTLKYRNKDNAPELPPEFLGGLPSLKFLDCIDDFNVGPLLRYLGQPSHDADGNLRWPCPKLSTITIRNDTDGDALLEDVTAFAKYRYASAQESSSGDGPGPMSKLALPAPLERLRVLDHLVERLRAIPEIEPALHSL
ncbi:hypothetical protein FRB99_008093 [Tulasnella sp. 403]|nr:hypothetical protein FRB99_008093 [Tulasnella sp. 403]